MHVSVVIPWSARPELGITLPVNAALFAKHSAEVIVVNCGGSTETLDPLLHAPGLDTVRCVTLPGAPFNRSLAKNIGISCCTGDIVFFLDADILLESDVFRDMPALAKHRRVQKIRTVRESRPSHDPTLGYLDEQIVTHDIRFKNGGRAKLEFIVRGDGSRCGSGLLMVEKCHAVAVNGFNSELEGWGFEDIDFQLRLQAVLALQLVSAGDVVHLSHGDEQRGLAEGQSRDLEIRRNMSQCYGNYSRGNFQGSYSRDVEAWQDRLQISGPPSSGHNSAVRLVQP